MNIPNGLPTLSKGAHRPGEGKAVESKYLGPDAWRNLDGTEGPNQVLADAFDEGLETAADLIRNYEEEK